MHLADSVYLDMAESISKLSKLPSSNPNFDISSRGYVTETRGPGAPAAEPGAPPPRPLGGLFRSARTARPRRPK